jgi:hypothetical protein
MRTKLRLLTALVSAAAVASIVAHAGRAATVSLDPVGPCCDSELPLHYDADPGETNEVQIFMTVSPTYGSPSGTWIVVDNSASITAGPAAFPSTRTLPNARSHPARPSSSSTRS